MNTNVCQQVSVGAIDLKIKVSVGVSKSVVEKEMLLLLLGDTLG